MALSAAGEPVMPTIKDFGGCKIHMYFEDHNPPHFHVVGPDFAAKIALSDLSVLSGSLPRKARKALEWAEENRDLLEEFWLKHSG